MKETTAATATATATATITLIAIDTETTINCWDWHNFSMRNETSLIPCCWCWWWCWCCYWWFSTRRDCFSTKIDNSEDSIELEMGLKYTLVLVLVLLFLTLGNIEMCSDCSECECYDTTVRWRCCYYLSSSLNCEREFEWNCLVTMPFPRLYFFPIVYPFCTCVSTSTSIAAVGIFDFYSPRGKG